jgi:hypothetical protein
MPAPIVVPIAVAIARAIAAQAAKQGVKQISKNQTKKITAKVIAKSGGRNKISSVAARRIAEEAAGPKARRLGGNAALRATKPKPDVRITTRTSRGTTVTKPVKRETNKKGSAITVRKTEPRKAAEVRAERAKAKRAKLREALTPRVNPARPKPTPKRGSTGTTDNNAREKEIIDRYYRIKFRDRGGPELKGAQSSIESRIASGVEKPTRGSVPSKYDKEAGARIDEATKVSSRLKATVKPGKPTKTTVALRTVGGSKATKAARNAELKGIIRNQRRVLKEREIKEAGERIRKAEEAAKIREAAAKRSGKGLLKGRVIK